MKPHDPPITLLKIITVEVLFFFCLKCVYINTHTFKNNDARNCLKQDNSQRKQVELHLQFFFLKTE